MKHASHLAMEPGGPPYGHPARSDPLAGHQPSRPKHCALVYRERVLAPGVRVAVASCGEARSRGGRSWGSGADRLGISDFGFPSSTGAGCTPSGLISAKVWLNFGQMLVGFRRSRHELHERWLDLW